MLKSKLGIKNKDKDTNSSSNVNNKDSNVHSKSFKKLLNGKTTGYSILNNIKGSFNDLNNNDKNDEDENDNTTLASTSPKTLEPFDVDKHHKISTKTITSSTENQDLNNLYDTQSSPTHYWASSVASSKGLANNTFDSLKTLTSSSNHNSPKSNSASQTNISIKSKSNSTKSKTTNKSNSPFLAPSKSPLEAISTKFSRFKSSENVGSNSLSTTKRNSDKFLSVPDIANNKDLQTSIVSIPSSESGPSNKSVSKKLSKKEKKDFNTSTKDGKKPSSIFSSIGKYFKNKTVGQLKDKENKKSKEKVEVIDVTKSNENIDIEKEDDIEIRTREISTLKMDEKLEMKTLNPNSIHVNIDSKEEIDSIHPENLKIPKPKEKIEEEVEIEEVEIEEEEKEKEKEKIGGEEKEKEKETKEKEKIDIKRISVEFSSKVKNQSITSTKTIPSKDLNPNPSLHSDPNPYPNRKSTSTQSMTLVENQVNNNNNNNNNNSSSSSSKSEAEHIFSSTSTQPIPIDNNNSLSVIDSSMKITSSPSSIQLTEENLNILNSEDNTEVKDIEIEKEGTYRQSHCKTDDNSSIDNEDTIIKKSSIISSNNNRLSVRDINFCRELRLAGSLESNRNSLKIESTITQNKITPPSDNGNHLEPTKSSSIQSSDTKIVGIPNSPLANALYTTVRPSSKEVQEDNNNQGK